MTSSRTSAPSPAPGKPDWAKTPRDLRREAAGPRPVWRRWLWPVVVLVLLGAGVLWLGGRGGEQVAQAPEGAATEGGELLLHPLDVTEVTRGTLRDTLQVTGTLQPRMQIQINSKVAGTVETVTVRLGDRVRQGDLLLQIEAAALRIQLEQQKATLEASRAQLALAETQALRSEELADRGVSASAALETARSNLDVQRANLAVQEAVVAAAEVALRDATVTAAFDGIIAAREVEPGQSVGAGTALFQLADLSTMVVRANVPVASSIRLEPGQTVTFTIEGLAGRSFQGHVEGISPTTISGSRNTPVVVVVENPEGILRGGMFASGDIVLEIGEAAIGIPAGSLRQDAEGPYVLKIDGGVLVRQTVEPGRLWEGETVIGITSGLAPGDRIVSGRLPDLDAGMAVRVTETQ